MATTPGPKAPVSAPPILQPSRSLLASVGFIEVSREEEAGVVHVEGRGDGAVIEDWCDPGAVSVTDDCRQAERTSFVLIAGELRPSKSTFAAGRVSLAERLASARANLARTESYRVARELLYGAETTANTWGNPYLTDPTILDFVSPAAQPFTRALDRLVDEWSDRMLGERGLIHAPPAVLRAWLEAGIVVERGNRVFDAAMGHEVVSDAAYVGANPTGPGSADPLGQEQWVFMSPNIEVRLGPVGVIPESENDLAGAIDRLANTLTVFAFRSASYTFETPEAVGDPLAVLAVPVDLCSRDCVPGES